MLKVKTTTYDIKLLSFHGPKIWNSLPDEIKTAQNAKKFKNLIPGSVRTNVRVLYAASKLLYELLYIALC